MKEILIFKWARRKRTKAGKIPIGGQLWRKPPRQDDDKCTPEWREGESRLVFISSSSSTSHCFFYFFFFQFLFRLLFDFLLLFLRLFLFLFLLLLPLPPLFFLLHSSFILFFSVFLFFSFPLHSTHAPRTSSQVSGAHDRSPGSSGPQPGLGIPLPVARLDFGNSESRI